MTRPDFSTCIDHLARTHQCFYKSFAMDQHDAIDSDTSPLSSG